MDKKVQATQYNRSMLVHLPRSLLCLIGQFLPDIDHFRAARTSKVFDALAKDPNSFGPVFAWNGSGQSENIHTHVPRGIHRHTLELASFYASKPLVIRNIRVDKVKHIVVKYYRFNLASLLRPFVPFLETLHLQEHGEKSVPSLNALFAEAKRLQSLTLTLPFSSNKLNLPIQLTSFSLEIRDVDLTYVPASTPPPFSVQQMAVCAPGLRYLHLKNYNSLCPDKRDCVFTFAHLEIAKLEMLHPRFGRLGNWSECERLHTIEISRPAGSTNQPFSFVPNVDTTLDPANTFSGNVRTLRLCNIKIVLADLLRHCPFLEELHLTEDRDSIDNLVIAALKSVPAALEKDKKLGSRIQELKLVSKYTPLAQELVLHVGKCALKRLHFEWTDKKDIQAKWNLAEHCPSLVKLTWGEWGLDLNRALSGELPASLCDLEILGEEIAFVKEPELQTHKPLKQLVRANVTTGRPNEELALLSKRAPNLQELHFKLAPRAHVRTSSSGPTPLYTSMSERTKYASDLEWKMPNVKELHMDQFDFVIGPSYKQVPILTPAHFPALERLCIKPGLEYVATERFGTRLRFLYKNKDESWLTEG